MGGTCNWRSVGSAYQKGLNLTRPGHSLSIEHHQLGDTSSTQHDPCSLSGSHEEAPLWLQGRGGGTRGGDYLPSRGKD